MTSQALNRSVDVLQVIARHRDAHKSLSETDAYSAQEYPRLAATYDAVAELIEALSECVADMQATEEFYGKHPRAQEVLARATAALAAIGAQP
jgi:hypothetical protein